jgi:hypothetical protein
MPLDAAIALQFDRDQTYANLNEEITIEKILAERWRIQNPQDKSRVMWDLALLAAYLHPELSQMKSVKTPLENTSR